MALDRSVVIGILLKKGVMSRLDVEVFLSTEEKENLITKPYPTILTIMTPFPIAKITKTVNNVLMKGLSDVVVY